MSDKKFSAIYYANQAVAELTLCARKIKCKKAYKQAQKALNELNELRTLIIKDSQN